MPDDKVITFEELSADVGRKVLKPVTEEELRAKFAEAQKKLWLPVSWPPKKIKVDW